MAIDPLEPSSTTPPAARGVTPKKDRPTPTRAEAEQARRDRLNPKLTKAESRAKVRQSRAARRQESVAKVEMTPQRVLLRDYVDSRWTLSEFMMPAMLILLAASVVLRRSVTGQAVVSSVMAVLFIGWVADTFRLWRGFKREATERLGLTSFRGLWMYLNTRAMNIRRFRVPGPRIERGAEY